MYRSKVRKIEDQESGSMTRVVCKFDGDKLNFENWIEKVVLALTLADLDDMIDEEFYAELPDKENEANGVVQKKMA